MEIIEGKAFLLNDNVDTDQILPGYAMSYPVSKLKDFALIGSDIPDFAKIINEGDLIFAGNNFGCGSSREQAPIAIKSSGCGAIIASSFARIFLRNAINVGLPVLISNRIDEIRKDLVGDDVFEVDILDLILKNITIRKSYNLEPISESTLTTLQAGGLMNKVEKILRQRGGIID